MARKKKEEERKKVSKKEANRELTDEEIEIELEKLEEGEAEVKKDDIKKYPKIQIIKGVKYVRHDFAKKEDMIAEYDGEFPFDKVDKKKAWWKPWTWKGLSWIFGNDKKNDLKRGNLLVLLDNEMGVRIFENVEPGIFRIKEFEGTPHERENFIILKPNKLRTYQDSEGNLIRCWFGDINNATALPDEANYSAKSVGEAIRTAVTDRREFEMQRKESWWKKYTWLLPAIAILIYFLYYFGILDSLIASFRSSGTTEVVKETITEKVDVPGGALNIIPLMFGGKLWKKKKSRKKS